MKTTKYAVVGFLLSLCLSACGDGRSSSGNGKYSALKEQIEEANSVLPGEIWDGQKLKSLSFDEDNEVLDFSIVKAKSYNFSECETKGETGFGQWIIANFIFANYECEQGEPAGDGDETIYKNVGKVLNQLKQERAGIRIRITGRDDRAMTILLDETETMEAIKEWKNIIDFDERNEPAFE